MRLLFAAGGTGGHLRPALATADAVRRRAPSTSVLFLTSGRPVDDRFLAGTGYGQVPLFPGRSTAPSRRDVIGFARALQRARHVLRDFEPDAVVGFGGYPTALAGAAALARRRRPPLVLLEQNAAAGRAVRLLARFAARVLLSFEDARRDLPHSVDAVVAGNPLPAAITRPSPPAEPHEFGLREGPLTVLGLGGSQGARAVNRLLLASREAMAASGVDVQVLLLAGEGELPSVESALASAPAPPTQAVGFETRMREVYELADVVVARAGGTTLAELAVIGRPLVLVPYPHHKDQHQRKNALVFERAGAARIVDEGPGDEERARDAILGWLGDSAARERAGEAARTLAFPDAAATCAAHVLEIASRTSAS